MNNNLLIKELQKICLDYLNELENIEKFTYLVTIIMSQGVPSNTLKKGTLGGVT